MTTTQPRFPFTRWIDVPLAAVRHLNKELTGAGAAMARTNRFPQPGPQADVAQVKRVHPASDNKALIGV